MKHIVAVAIALILLIALPTDAWACPMCFDASAENRMAFLMTAVVLTALPLGMVSGVGVWLRKKFRENGEAATSDDPDASGVEPGPSATQLRRAGPLLRIVSQAGER